MNNGQYYTTMPTNNTADDHTHNIEWIITDILKQSGFNPALLGFGYIRQAVILCYDDPDLLICKSKILYPRLAKKFNIGVNSVERNIRSVINSTWKKCAGNDFYLRTNCRYILDNKRPTCSEVINILTYYLTENNL